MPALTFVAPANAVRYVGAWPTFVDTDPTRWQMSASALEGWLADWHGRNGLNRATGRPLKAILAVSILGGMPDMPRIKAAALDHQLPLIEDASQSLGAMLGDRPAGSFGHVACLSFNANKTVAGPGGGMLLTDRHRVAQRARHLASQARSGPGYIHDEVGYNYRLSNLQAAVVLGQMERLTEILAAKRAVAAAYASVLGDLPGVGLMPIPEGVLPSWWLWTAHVPDRRRLEAALYAQGIESRPLWQPLHVSPAHGGYCTGTGRVALWLWHNALSLPSSPGLGAEGARRVAEKVREFILTSGKAESMIAGNNTD